MLGFALGFCCLFDGSMGNWFVRRRFPYFETNPKRAKEKKKLQDYWTDARTQERISQIYSKDKRVRL